MNRRRNVVGVLFTLGVSIAAIAAALAISIGIIAAFGGAPVASLKALYEGAFGNRAQLGGTLSKTVPLLLVGLGWITAWSTRRINIGFEGQILVGGIAATVVGLDVNLPRPVHLPLAVLAGVLAGAAYAAIPAGLWARRHVSEVISTLMLNYVAAQLVSWLVRGPLQESTHSFPFTPPVPISARWPVLLSGTGLAWDFVLALLVTFGVRFMLRRTSLGFRFRVSGGNVDAARRTGVGTVRMSVLALVISGALAGLAGSSLILAGESGTMTDGFSANYGFDGIVVALLARNSPVGAIPAALLLGALRQGSGYMEATVGVSSALADLIQGLVIVFVAGTSYLLYRREAARVDVDEVAEPIVPEAGDRQEVT